MRGMTSQRERTSMKGSIRRLVTSGLAVGALATGLITTVPAVTASAGASTPTVATWAEPPQNNPGYIFPFMSPQVYSVANINNFQFLMYRPLYWFGNGSTPNLDPSLSLAHNPQYSNGSKTVTVELKNYKWSNGESVTGTDVLFWMNMLHAEKSNWGDYSPGALPDDVKNVTVNSPTKVTFTLKAPVNTYWFTYNELSQITPLPLAWDITSSGAAAGSGGCAKAAYGTADSACTAVYTFLSKQAGYDPANPSSDTTAAAPTYATNPIWQVVDGPWRLTHFDASGNVTMVPNKSYSGPIKPTIKEFQEIPFTTDSAEFNDLVSGSIDVGYLPFTEVTASTSNPTKAEANNPRLSSNYTMDPLYTWSINYFPYNFNSTGDGGAAGPIFKQLYFRQAFQTLVDQPLYNQKINKGYGIGTYGPVPVYPQNSYASSTEKSNPYPYNPSKAKTLLSSHGWKVVPGGTSTCTKPGTGKGECGAGIQKGAKLAFNLQYVTGQASLTQQMNAEKSSWAQAGINVTLSGASFTTVTGNAVACTGGQSCSWEMQYWGGGWVFAPDYYPTGESIFQTGAGSNYGSYNDKTNDSNIAATTSSNESLTKYENYLAEQLPIVYQPNPATSLTEIKKGLTGVTPQSPLDSINPENWRF